MIYTGLIRKGHGGASKCFMWENERRINEIQAGLGIRPVAGSLNIQLDKEFDWSPSLAINFLVMDVIKRPSLLGEWDHFVCSFYPCKLKNSNGDEARAWAMRFKKDIDVYRKDFVELVSDVHIRTQLNLNDGEKIELTTLLDNNV